MTDVAMCDPSQDEARISFRLPMDVKRVIEESANANGRSVSEEIRARLQEDRGMFVESSPGMLAYVDATVRTHGFGSRSDLVRYAIARIMEEGYR